MCFSQYSPRPNRYQLAAQLKGHTDSVQSLSITQRGDLLASGGENFINVFNDQRLMCVKVLMVFVCGT
jgi:WD40 repeat protein